MKDKIINMLDFDKYFEKDKVYKSILYSIFIIAVGFRIYRIFITGPVSYDEAYSTWVGSKKLFSLIALSATDKHPPLFYLFMHFWNFFFYSEFWIRIPSLIASILSLYFFIKISEQVLKSRLAILSAFLLFAADISQIHYASIARSYAIATLLVLISVYTFFKILQGNNEKKWFWINLISNVILLLLLYTGGFVFFAQFLIITVNFYFKPDKRQSVKRWLKYHIILLLTCIALVPYVYNQFQIGGFAPKWIAELIGEPWKETLFLQGTLLNLRLYKIELWEFRLILGGLITLTIFLSGISFNKQFKLKINSDFKFWTLIFIYAFPPIVFWLVSKIEPIFVPRYFMIFYFAYYLLLTYALYNLKYLKRLAPVFILFFFFGVTPLFQAFFSEKYKESDWKTKSSTIIQNWQKNDVILVVPHADGLRAKFYLRDMNKYKIDLNIYRDIFRSKTEQTTIAILDSTFLDWKYPYKRIWFHEEIGTGLSAEFKIVQKEGFIFHYLDSLFFQYDSIKFEDDRGKLSLFRIKE